LTAATPGFPDFVVSRDAEGPLRPETHAAGFIAGAAAAVAVLEALFARLLDGAGRQVDVSVQEAVASTMIRDIASYTYAGIVSGRRTEAEQSGTAYAPNIYLPCKDGMIVLITPSEEAWKKLVELMGHPEWARQPEFQDSAARARNIDDLVPHLTRWTMTLTGAEITRITQANGLPCAHVHSIPAMAGSAHVRERNALAEVDIGGSKARMPGPPFRIEGLFGAPRRAAPRKGEHNRRILCDRLGYSAADVQRLRAAGAI
jgi:crotonobetainyl-CoA:carnitine CoA-transferase CaiB-like acyl-CoA transferase